MSSVRPAQGCSSFKKSLTERRQKFLMKLSPSAQQLDRILGQCPRDLGAGTEGSPSIWPRTGHSSAAGASAHPCALKPFEPVLGEGSIFSPPSVNLVYA